MNEQPHPSKFKNLVSDGANSELITVQMVLRLRAGVSVARIATMFGVTRQSVYARLALGARDSAINTPRIAGPVTAKSILNLPADKLSREQASIAHLIDLKRAGHSPKRTELDIPPDNSAVSVCSHERADLTNLCGDPAPGRSALDGYVHIGEGSGQQDAEVKRNQNRRYYARLAAQEVSRGVANSFSGGLS